MQCVVHIMTEELGKIIAIVCGLVINLVFNFIANSGTLSIKGNKCKYFLICILSGVFFVSVNYFSRLAKELTLLFYGVIGLSVPQIALYLMTINNLTEKVKDSETALENYRNMLYLQDIPQFVNDKDKGMSCIDIKKRALEKSEHYRQKGIFDQKRAEDYLVTVKMQTDCFW